MLLYDSVAVAPGKADEVITKDDTGKSGGVGVDEEEGGGVEDDDEDGGVEDDDEEEGGVDPGGAVT